MGKDRKSKTQRETVSCRSDVKKINYDIYKFSRMECFLVLLQGVVGLMAVGYLFYGSVISVIFLSPFLIFYIKSQKRKRNQKRKEGLVEEFKETLLLVEDALEAGYSLENSFVESYSMIKERYGSNSDMVQELYIIKQSLRLNIKLEDVLMDLAVRSGIEDIRDFAVVFSQAKRGGGSMGVIMKRSIGMIREKIEIKREIQIMISGKKYEQNIMNMVPIGIMAYISMTSKGFFDVMYGNATGIIIMSLCLLVYLAALCLGDYFLQIEV